MKIILEHISKRFQRHWIFKEVNTTFSAPGAYALLGPNGSGKSTLLRIVAGMQAASKGKVLFQDNSGSNIPNDKIFTEVSFCAPGQELIEELTLAEFLDFHFSFKRPLPGLSVAGIIEMMGLENSSGKQINDFSSGMKQRVKLAQAIFADTPVLLLDEPCTNLDQAGVDQYRSWMEQYIAGRLVVIASNDVREHYFCREQLVMERYK
jgi:ABC-type multidrug transport system ATPase subunit